MRSNYQFRPNPQIDTIIFDLDDTLISWAKARMSWTAYALPLFARVPPRLAELGYTVDVGKLAQIFGRVMREESQKASQDPEHSAVSLGGIIHRILREFDLPADEIDIDALMQFVDGKTLDGVALYPDTHAVLDELRARGYKIGLITNSFSPMWIRDVELDAYGLIDRFDARITSGDTGFMKPHPAIFWRMLGLLNSTPDRAMYVGDSPTHDVRGANETGLTSVHIDPPHLNKRPKSPIEQPDYTIVSLTDLLPILDKLSV